MAPSQQPTRRPATSAAKSGSAARSQKRSPKNAEPPKRRRLAAAERRHSILEAARRAFSETGDVNGTTIKVIAEKSGISEGIIYRHFESKEQLYFEAIVEPLEQAILAMVEITHEMDAEGFTEDRRVEATRQMYKRLAKIFAEQLPLLGLVLFGDPEVARKFYRGTFSKAVNNLAKGWDDFFDQYDVELPSRHIASAVVGIGLMLAVDSRFSSRFDLNEACANLAELTLNGFFPKPESYGLGTR